MTRTEVDRIGATLAASIAELERLHFTIERNTNALEEIRYGLGQCIC